MATPANPQPEPKFHIKPSTALKVSRTAIFVLLAIISIQTVNGALLWYANKIKAASTSVRTVNLSAAEVVANPGGDSVSLHAAAELPEGITERGFEYGTDTNYGSQVLDSTSTSTYGSFGNLGNISFGAGYGTTADAADNMYVTYFDEGGNAKIVKYNKNGDTIAQYGSQGSGDGQFNQPMDITLDASGNMFVADWENSRVQKLDSSGNFVSKFATAEQSTGSVVYPTTIAVDASGNVFIAGYWDADPGLSHDWTPIAQKYNAGGSLVAQFIDGYGAATNQLYSWGQWPDLAVDASGNVYVSDIYNQRVLKYDNNGTFIEQWGTTGVASASQGQFDRPWGLLIKGGLVYVTDTGNDRIQAFSTDGTYVSEWTGITYMQSLVNIDARGALYIRAGTGIVTGQAPIEATLTGLTCGTTYHYRAFVTDATGTDYSSDDTFTTSDCPPPPPPAINITTTSLEDGNTALAYDQAITVENGIGTLGFTVASGSLPSGLTLQNISGTYHLAGTPSAAGTYNFTLRVYDTGRENWLTDPDATDAQAYTVTITSTPPPALEIATTALPDGTINVDYLNNVYTNNAVGAVTYSIIDGELPPGLQLYNNNDGSVLVGGIPSTPGNYEFMLEATDSRPVDVAGGSATQAYSITITGPVLTITTTSLPDGQVFFSYNSSISYVNAISQPVFTLASGTLPPGVSLSIAGYLQGTATTAGTYNFTVQATDGFNTDTQALSVTIQPGPTIAPNSPLVTITSPANGSSTTATSLDITGTGPANNKVIQVAVDDVVRGTTTTNSSGQWSFRAEGLSVSAHSVDATWIPGNDVAFVPVVNQAAGTSDVEVIDNASKELITDIHMPYGFILFGATLNHSRTKLYTYGMQIRAGEGIQGVVRETDISSMSQRSQFFGTLSAGSITKMTVSSDDTSAVIEAGTSVNGSTQSALMRINLSSLAVVGDAIPAIGNGWSDVWTSGTVLSSNNALAYSVFGNSTTVTNNNKLLVATLQDGSRSEVDLGDGSGYTPVALRRSGESLYVLTRSHLLTIDTQTFGILNDLNLGNDPSSDPVFGLEVDTSGSIAYAVKANTLLSINVLNNSVQTHTVAGLQAPPVMGMASMGLTTDGTELYIPSFAGGLKIWNTQSNSLVPNTSGLVQNGLYSYSLNGDSYIAPIRPTATVNFAITDTPVTSTCVDTNTCPTNPTCTATNTCPTNPTCTATNTCPVTINPNPSPIVRVINTPLPQPTLKPNVSRLNLLDRGVLKLAQFVPQEAAIGFPYLLFLLLLLFALSLYYQSSNEIKKDKLNREFVAKRKSIRAQQDNFIALASHYLNTPISIIQGGVEMEGDKLTKPGKGKS